MLITRESDYALRIIRALADGELHTVGDIVESQLIPRQFTYKIIKKLSNGGLIRILRGSTGGCQLAVDLNEATLYDLMDAMEDGLKVNACMQEGFECTWKDRNKVCTVHCKLAAIQEHLNEELKSHTLASLMVLDEQN